MEENLETTFGLNSPASETLWKIIKDEPESKRFIFSLLNKTIAYFKSLESVKDIRVRRHLMVLLYNDFRSRTNNSYLKNIISSIYRENLRKTYEI